MNYKIKTEEEILFEVFQEIMNIETLDEIFPPENDFLQKIKVKAIETMDMHANVAYLARTKYNHILPDSYAEEAMANMFIGNIDNFSLDKIFTPGNEFLQILKDGILTSIKKYSGQPIEFIEVNLPDDFQLIRIPKALDNDKPKNDVYSSNGRLLTFQECENFVDTRKISSKNLSLLASHVCQAESAKRIHAFTEQEGVIYLLIDEEFVIAQKKETIN